MAEGKWSIKDILGHLAAWEGEVVKGFRQKANGERLITKSKLSLRPQKRKIFYWIVIK